MADLLADARALVSANRKRGIEGGLDPGRGDLWALSLPKNSGRHRLPE